MKVLGSDRGVPLLVGVVGHRDIPSSAEPHLRSRFREVLAGISQAHPHSPLRVLTALAPGADTIATEVAMESGVAVVACLPMPAAGYRALFAPHEVERFDRALSSCEQVRVVGASDDPVANYVAASAFISYYCYQLVAFWDGAQSRGPGGTADAVDARMAGTDPAPVIQIVTPREGDPAPRNAYGVRRIFPVRFEGDSRAEADFVLAGSNLDRFNADLATATGEIGSLADLRRRTDQLATSLKQRSLSYLNVLFALALLTGLVQLAPLGAYAVVVRVAFLASAFVTFALARRSDDQNRHQDYRAIAEALRVQLAWCDAGVCGESVESSYLQMQRTDLQWIRVALKSAHLVLHDSHVAGPSETSARPWIEEQKTFYIRQSRRDAARLALVRRITDASFGVALVMLIACGSALLLARGAGGAHAAGDVRVAATQIEAVAERILGHENDWLPFLTTAPLALAGLLGLLLEAYAYQRGFLENARRYERMFAVFDGALQRLDRVGDAPDDARALLRELGKEALAEHAYWLMLRRERPLRVLKN